MYAFEEAGKSLIAFSNLNSLVTQSIAVQMATVACRQTMVIPFKPVSGTVSCLTPRIISLSIRETVSNIMPIAFNAFSSLQAKTALIGRLYNNQFEYNINSNKDNISSINTNETITISEVKSLNAILVTRKRGNIMGRRINEYAKEITEHVFKRVVYEDLGLIANQFTMEAIEYFVKRYIYLKGGDLQKYYSSSHFKLLYRKCPNVYHKKGKPSNYITTFSKDNLPVYPVNITETGNISLIIPNTEKRLAFA